MPITSVGSHGWQQWGRLVVYTGRKVLAEFAVCGTDDAIAKLYVTQILVK